MGGDRGAPKNFGTEVELYRF